MGNTIISEAVPRKNRLLVCPECVGKLSNDRNAYTSKEVLDRGFIYRTRRCLNCHAIYHTKQGAEEITGMEPPLM